MGRRGTASLTDHLNRVGPLTAALAKKRLISPRSQVQIIEGCRICLSDSVSQPAGLNTQEGLHLSRNFAGYAERLPYSNASLVDTVLSVVYRSCDGPMSHGQSAGKVVGVESAALEPSGDSGDVVAGAHWAQADHQPDRASLRVTGLHGDHRGGCAHAARHDSEC